MHGIQGAFPTNIVAIRDSADDVAIKTLSITLKDAIEARPSPGEPWTPHDAAWNALTELDRRAKPLAPTETRNFADSIRQWLNEVPRFSPDVLLLDRILDNALGNTQRPLKQYLGEKAFESLELPRLNVLEPGEVEPNSRTFDSVLPSLALGVHEYGPFGRTLLWHGARHLLAGPSGDASESRVEALQKVMFSFPNKSHLGDSEVPTIQEFVAELDLLDSREGIYEGTHFDAGLPPIIV
ncbi:hypothetical protein PAQ31011_00395 [Pandoraea aquatica]|uniref:Uncharacterized protein n=1 Tax=Pandoraea aquatica TaxID=2508290 RepID=A0A5E4RYK2_9BURK|nr:hypothetical protein [Pandoraea aquatica]VVD66949.1 hypothetical protein PAQ31011_00395 [Pandoraea aquatica]